MKILLIFLFAVIFAVFVAVPMSAGYWTIHNKRAFTIPLEYWIPSFLTAFVFAILLGNIL